MRELCDCWSQDNCHVKTPLFSFAFHECIQCMHGTPPSLITAPQRDGKIGVLKHLYLDLLRHHPRYRNFRTAGHKTSKMSVRCFAAGHLVALYVDFKSAAQS